MITLFLIMATLGGSSQVQSPSRVSCVVQPSSVLSRSSSGVAQVSNLQLIQIECRLSPPRRLPQSGQLRSLTVEAVVYQVTDEGTKRVPSEVAASGSGGNLQGDSTYFYLSIPIDDSERDAASRAFIEEIARRAASSPNESDRALLALLQGKDAARGMAQMVRQHRVGRFRVEFRILDEGRLVGVANLDLEVIFKGAFFDQILRAQ